MERAAVRDMEGLKRIWWKQGTAALQAALSLHEVEVEVSIHRD